jgi:hypothetical protein
MLLADNLEDLRSSSSGNILEETQEKMSIDIALMYIQFLLIFLKIKIERTSRLTNWT